MCGGIEYQGTKVYFPNPEAKEWRRSLRTKNFHEAASAAYRFGATIHGMAKDLGYIVRLPSGASIETDGSAEDHARAMEALQQVSAIDSQAQVAIEDIRKAVSQANEASPKSVPTLTRICLRDAVRSYEPYIKGADKSVNMAKKTLSEVVTSMGADFDMAQFSDTSISEKWMVPRSKVVAGSTLKKELSWVRGFADWASHNSRKYCPAPLALAVRRSY